MKTCQRCGQAFGCEAKNKDVRCWCMDAPTPIHKIPEQYKDCLCKDCLKVFTKPNGLKRGDLIEGEDFYLEQGFHVFTRQYHLNKGYCCHSGCRHCPYQETD